MFCKKNWLRGFIVIFLCVFTLQASAWFIPALGTAARFFSGPLTNTTIWLGRTAAADVTFAKSLEWSIAIMGGILGAVTFGSDEPPTSTTTLKAKIVVSPNKDQITTNPDPIRYDDAPSSSDPLQPTAKSSYQNVGQSTTQCPGTYPGIVTSMASGDWCQGNSTTDVNYVYFKSTDPNNAVQPNNYIPSASVQLTQLPANYTRTWAGPVTTGSGTFNYTIGQLVVSKACVPGYLPSGSTCVKTNESAIVKPAGTVPCEVTRKSNGEWYIDPKNPECTALQAAIVKSADGKKVTIDNGSGKVLTVTEKDNGGRVYDIQEGGVWRSIDTGPYDGAQGGRPILSITDGGGTNPNTGTCGGVGQPACTTCGGVGQPACTNTGGGGSCGGTGQPACGIDDSGFNGKATDGNGLLTKIDANDQSITDKFSGINPTDKHGMDWTWLPQIPRVQCVPFEYGTAGHIVVIDWCSRLAVIREALGWLLYIFMAWGLFDLLVSGTTTKGKR